MQIQIREVKSGDLKAVAALNEQGVPQVNHLEWAQIEWFFEHAAYFRVADVDSHLSGILIAVAHDCGYQSKYFQWFDSRYTPFIYIDRVVVAPRSRRQRLAWRLYEGVERYAAAVGYCLTTDVYSDPPNHVSLEFHQKYGFQLVGTQLVENNSKAVAKFVKIPDPPGKV